MNRRPAVLECFAGIGGLALAWQRAGARHHAMIEIDPLAREVLRQHFLAPIYTDIRFFDGEPLRGRIDILSGGPPCQPASFAGSRRGASDDRWLWPDYLRLVREIGPTWVLAENPPGIATLEPGLDWITDELESLGYSVGAFGVGALEAGAPQIRRRIWIVAHADSQRQSADWVRGLLDSEREAQRRDSDGRSDWPARRGEPQAEWEPDRIRQLPVGGGADGVSRRLARRARAGLRLTGNAVVPQCAELFTRPIVTAWHAEMSEVAA